MPLRKNTNIGLYFDIGVIGIFLTFEILEEKTFGIFPNQAKGTRKSRAILLIFEPNLSSTKILHFIKFKPNWVFPHALSVCAHEGRLKV